MNPAFQQPARRRGFRMPDEKDPPCQDRELLRLFKIALETRNVEISLFWQRSNYFLVLNTALAVGFFSLKEQRGAYAIGLAIFGALASVLWLLVNAGGKYWQSRWEHELTLRERKLYPEDPMFAAPAEQTKDYVRQSLNWGKHGRLHRIADQVVLLKPSVTDTSDH